MHLRPCLGHEISKENLRPPCSIGSTRRSRIEVPRVDYEKLSGDRVGEPSECIPARVQDARDLQTKRFSSNGSSDIVCNADMRVGEIRKFCKLHEENQSLMQVATSQLKLSARAYHRILKLAKTIADLAGSAKPAKG